MKLKSLIEQLTQSDEILSEKIVAKKIDGVKKWVVVSHEGKNLGAFPHTQNGKHQAHIRLAQVEAFKKRDEKKKAKVANESLELNEAQVNWVKGSELTPEQQKEVKAKFVHRHTGENKPEWAKQTWKDDQPYPLHFKDDKDWLENTKFAVTKTGKLCNRTKYCQSSPTFPNNPELRKNLKESIELNEAKLVTIKKDSSTGEYRVPAPDGKEAGAYYTDDKQDAIDTAKDMYKRAKITDIEIKFRTVSDFDMYNEAKVESNYKVICPECNTEISKKNNQYKCSNPKCNKFNKVSSSYYKKLKEATESETCPKCRYHGFKKVKDKKVCQSCGCDWNKNIKESNISKRLLDLNEANN